MAIMYAKKDKIRLYKEGSTELYININYFHKQIDIVVSDDYGEERFLPTDLSGALTKYKKLCSLHKKDRGLLDA